MDFVDFKIEIAATNKPDKFRLRVDSGNLSVDVKDFEITCQAEDAQLRNRIRFKQDGFLAEAEDVKALGLALLKRLFPDEAWDWFRKSQNLLLVQPRPKKGMRIRVKFATAASALNLVPWEYCYDQDRDGFLGLFKDTTIVRTLPTERPLVDLQSPRPRVLVAIASPRLTGDFVNLYQLGIVDEMNAAIAGIGSQVQVKKIVNATWKKVCDELKEGYDVFQFLGHGAAKDGEGGWLYFEQDGGKPDQPADPDRIMHADLVQHLGGAVKLCVLTACESAKHDPGNMFSGLAQGLVKADIPAVLGMQIKVGVGVATIFTQSFYRALVKADPVDEALLEARRDIASSEKRAFSWGIPVLYLQSEDGRIWPDKSARQKQRAAEAMVERQQVVAAAEPEDAQPKPIHRLLEALNTLNFTKQINAYQAIRESSRATAVLLSGDKLTGLDALNWLREVLIADVRDATQKGVRRINLTSRITAGKSQRLWDAVANSLKMPSGDPAAVAKAVVDQLADHSVIFVVVAGGRVHLPTLLNDFWAKIVACAAPLETDKGSQRTTVSLLVIDDNYLSEPDTRLLERLPAVEPISEDTFTTWYRTATPLLPENMKDRRMAGLILHGNKNGHGRENDPGSENGYRLDNTEGYATDLLINLDQLCNGILAYMRT
jgi:hypothetical protein